MNDRVRFALWFALLASIWLGYATWLADQQTATPAQSASSSGPGIADDPLAPGSAPDDVPSVGEAAGADPLPSATTDQASLAPARTVTVQTDVLDLVINLDGGDIVRTDLTQYPVHKDTPDTPVRLLDYTADNYWVFQTGLAADGEQAAPTHEQPFTAAQNTFVLADGSDTLEVRLNWTGPDGLSATKVYTFRRGAYIIDLDLQVSNQGTSGFTTRAYGQMVRRHIPPDRSFLDIDSYSFRGPTRFDGEKYEKIDFDDLPREPIDETVSNGWFASIQHHFLAALVPVTDGPVRYQARAVDNRYRLRILGDTTTVAPGSSYDYALTLFVGPKLQDQLIAAAPERELKRTVDYGMLYVLANPLFWLLDLIHGWVKNWGLSIILTTFVIKLAFYKLTATSGRSMAKMRKLAPRMKALQEKHKEDRQAYGAAMMELYKKEKVNPAAGCLPILIQMPFFFAFYWVLVESVEMRQAPFMLWINDLSVRDPFFILPGLMIFAMWFQMRLNPSPPDPIQARVMQIMPFFFGAMFAFFPSGLVLYWLTNTVVSIAQQWRINQLVAKES